MLCVWRTSKFLRESCHLNVIGLLEMWFTPESVKNTVKNATLWSCNKNALLTAKIYSRPFADLLDKSLLHSSSTAQKSTISKFTTSNNITTVNRSAPASFSFLRLLGGKRAE